MKIPAIVLVSETGHAWDRLRHRPPVPESYHNCRWIAASLAEYLAPQTGFALTTTWLTTDPDWRRVESLQFSVFSGWSAIHVLVIRHSCRFDHVLPSRSSLTGQYARHSPLVYPLRRANVVSGTQLSGDYSTSFYQIVSCACSALAGGKVFGRNERFSRACCRPRHRQSFPCPAAHHHTTGVSGTLDATFIPRRRKMELFGVGEESRWLPGARRSRSYDSNWAGHSLPASHLPAIAS